MAPLVSVTRAFASELGSRPYVHAGWYRLQSHRTSANGIEYGGVTAMVQNVLTIVIDEAVMHALAEWLMAVVVTSSATSSRGAQMPDRLEAAHKVQMWPAALDLNLRTRAQPALGETGGEVVA